MIKFVSQKITVFLLHQNVIEDEDSDIYRYGIELIVSSIISVLNIMLISFLFGIPFAGIVFLAVFIPLRMYAGGYHSDTYLKCNILFILVYLLVLLIWHGFIIYGLTGYSFIFMIAAFIVICLKAPVENRNKRITSYERKRYSRISLIIICLLVVISMGSFNVNENLSLFINITLFSVAVLILLAGKEDKQSEKIS